MAQATQANWGDMVKVQYKGHTEDGAVLDDSFSRGPLSFRLGTDEVITGFEEAIVGMAPGEAKVVRIPAERAFGPYQPDLVYRIERCRWPKGTKLCMGCAVRLYGSEEWSRGDPTQPRMARVAGIDNDVITLDANHPLAGQGLIFAIRLLEVLPGGREVKRAA